MAVEAGEIRGRLSIDLTDLDRLRSESAKAGQALKTNLGQKIQGGVLRESIQVYIAQRPTGYENLRSVGGKSLNAIRSSAKEI